MGFTTERQIAAELLSSSVCNADCTYCFIPKVTSLKDFLPKIQNSLFSQKYLKDLKNLYGDKLEHLSLWGTEPLTTLKDWNEELPKIINEFPNLKELSFSTNLFLTPTIITSCIEHLPKNRKGFQFNIQISIDGPPEITDNNRGKNSTNKITNNFLILLQLLNNIDLQELQINFSFKPTLSLDNIDWFLESSSRIWGYFFFFDILIDKANYCNKNKNVHLNLTGVPTIAVPGFYTTEDGIKVSKFFTELKFIELDNNERNIFKHIKGCLNIYEIRFKNFINFSSEFTNKPSMFTCSGGDSNFQMDCDGNIHICHRTLFYESKEYTDTLIKEEYMGKNDHFSNGLIKNIQKNWIVKNDNQDEINRFLYITGNYHNYYLHKIQFSLPVIYELANSGQISKIYSNENWATQLSIFTHAVSSCPAENILNNGNIYVPPISMFRLYGNGVFENILKSGTPNGL